MTDHSDAQMELLFSFFEGVQRKGPGSEASTLKALSLLDGLPPTPRIVDFGCGAGLASLVLARATQGIVTAVDIHLSYLQQLDAAAARDGLTDRIRTVQADMTDPPFPDGSFDLIWSEGAIHIVGFEQGLKGWRRLLRTGGFVVCTEISWLCETPPGKVVDFFKNEYPAMTDIEGNLATLRAAGFEPVDHFVLPPEDWENYYGPLQEQLAVFRSDKSGNTEAQAFADSLQQEIDIRKECSDSYGYVFYLGRANGEGRCDRGRALRR
ncbi:MAG: class I SAM-dependent methyltransferase [Planctomycetes bacterium]|nr:class I SAM-dependent methyltransferase [Planctomycetota bacterium]